jgi:hypothetical protein
MKSKQISKRHKNQVVWLAVFLALVTLSCGKIKSASKDLIGIWKATDIRYNDTYFEIEKKAITFRAKGGDSNSYAIVEIKKELMQDGLWVEYIIFYKDKDKRKVEFPFYFNGSDKSVIRFKNQPNLVWRKDVEITT